MSKNQEAKTALPPIRVLDLTEGGCMLGGKMFAETGADVIKIEPPSGSPSRIAPFYKNSTDPNQSLFWFAYNTNKRGITLNLKNPEGQEIFKKLAAKADIILESFGIGYLDNLKLGYADICKIKPDIILLSMSVMGHSGPWRDYSGFGPAVQAFSGLSYLTAYPGGGPVGCRGMPNSPYIRKEEH